MEPERNWLFCAEDENGDRHYLQDFYFTGTYSDACLYADIQGNEWEQKTGGLILRLVIQSHGIANKSPNSDPHPQADSGG